MTIRNVSEAKEQLSALLVLVSQGEEVIIARAGKPVARLTAINNGYQKREPGGSKGKIWIGADFDAPLREFEADFYGDPK